MPKRAPHSNALPASFLVLVNDARAGERSYADCGYELGHNIFSIVGEDLGEQALGEFVLRVPRMMALIPPRQYRSFMKGFLRAVEESRIEIDLSQAA